MNSHSSPESAFFDDPMLSAMLTAWQVPAVSPRLDRRVLDTFRRRSNSEVSLPDRAFAQPVIAFEENHMKLCESCSEEFSDQFVFCPIDGAPLTAPPMMEEAHLVLTEVAAESGYALASSEAYHLTLLDDAGLISRLSTQVRAVADESRLTWPEFRRDPRDFVRRSLVAYGGAAQRKLANPQFAFAAASAFALVIALVVSILMLDQYQAQKNALLAQNEELSIEQMIDISEPKPDEGDAGLNKGSGGGSKPKPEKAGGGGGGGRNEMTEASQGKAPQAAPNFPIIVPPNPKPPPPTADPLVVPPTMDVDPLLAPTDTSGRNFGDPNSQSTTPSSGQGSNGGIGSGNGAGVGPGDGAGYGPGEGRNTGGGLARDGGGGPGGGGTDYNKIFKSSDVTQKARVLLKPQPEYTEEARRAQTTGTVRLSVVFSASGQVTNIRPLSQLPFGLTDKAINAARKIQFTPAIKDGRPVSSYMVIEYNFNIY